MATKQIKKLSDLQKITTATGDQMIPVVDASGNVNPIKLTDLAQVVAGLIGVSTNNKDGLMGKDSFRFRGTFSKSNDLSIFTENGFVYLTIGDNPNDWPKGINSAILEIYNVSYSGNIRCFQRIQNIFSVDAYFRFFNGKWSAWIKLI